MEIFQAIVLGIVQGVTEFFPISSTAHLILIPWFFGWTGAVDSLEFDIALHVGTLLALVTFFFKDWLEMFFKKHKRRLLYLIIVATVPGAIAGKLLDKYAETSLRSPLIIAVSLIVVAIAMFISERVGIKVQTAEKLSYLDAVLVGIAQAFAIIPGVSRSGGTITMGMFLGMKRDEAARFSFLMCTPIVAGAAALHGYHILKAHSAGFNMPMFVFGVLASFISGVLTIKFLLSFFKRFSLNGFVYYRIVLALVIIATMVWQKS
ncbi:MAG: undecaprenyl-diphosphate phosphatase [Nitrospirae bacterium]|nr:undecaprenyl-diphosphate phosphatase [Nitrospirota bacterium]MBF0536268.1 undecaprenyl-diphosphate phosphatase [Nitrospirota bacterium]MBF0615798.1 undecaprenyl-diphosphate phosphatase [Nitrospirota bacterium]